MMNSFCTRAALLASLLSAGAAGDVRAETPPDDAMMAATEQLYDEASAARRDKKWAECRAKAKLAWSQERHPKIAAILGDCALYLGDAREAAEHLHFYLRDRTAIEDPALVDYFEKRLALAKAEVAELRVSVNVSGAVVELDGSPIDVDATHFVAPGEHRLAARHDGYEPLSRELALRKGTTETIPLELVRVNEPPVTAEPRGAEPWPWVAGFGLGLGVAGLGAAIGLTVAANDESARAESLRVDAERTFGAGGCGDAPLCRDLRSANDTTATLSNAALGTWIAGGGLTALGLVGLAMALSEPDGDTALIPSIAPGHVGATWSGRF